MFSKVLKWLPLLAAFTVSFAYAETEAPDMEAANDEGEVAYSFSERSRENNGKGYSLPCNKPCPTKPCKKPCKKPCPVPDCECKRMAIKPLPPCCTPCQPDCCPPMAVYEHNVTPPARCTDCNIGMFFTADFLWWKADEKGFGITFKTTDPVTHDIGTVERFKYKWDPGFRIGVGGNLPYDGWDLYFNWTCYRNKSRKHVSSATNGVALGLTGVWLNETPETVTSASAKYRLLLNMADLELGRDFYVSCGLSLRPFAGVEGGWIDRRFSVSYGPQDPTSDREIDAPGSYSAKTNVWGVGPRGGLNSTWHLGYGFNLLANFSYALLYGEVFHNHGKSVQTFDDVANVTTASVDDDDIWSLTPHLQSFLGIGWGSCFQCNKLYFAVNLGWEANYYFGLPHFVFPGGFAQTVFDSDGRDVSLVGLTLDFKLEF